MKRGTMLRVRQGELAVVLDTLPADSLAGARLKIAGERGFEVVLEKDVQVRWGWEAEGERLADLWEKQEAERDAALESEARAILGREGRYLRQDEKDLMLYMTGRLSAARGLGPKPGNTGRKGTR